MLLARLRMAAAAAALAAASAAAASTQGATDPARAALAAESVGLGPAAAVYEARGHAPIWLAGDGAAARTLIATLREAESHGLPTARYAPERLAAMVAEGGGPEAEIALSRAFLLYARDVSSGLLDPRGAVRNTWREPLRRDPAALLGGAADASDLAAFLAALPPQDPEYDRLRALYAELRDGENAGRWSPALGRGPTLREGDSGSQVAALRARLRALGDLDAAPAAAPELFDAALADAVRGFQRRHGLNQDAAVGPRTRAALDAEPGWRVTQAAINLERLRWMNRPLGGRRVVVNQADFTVTLSENGRVLFRERVVIGTPRDQTVEFSDEMEYLVLNPTWHVPRSIATEELLPQLREDPALLARRNMRLTRSDGGPVPLDPSSHDFSDYTAADFPYRIRQRPSAGNALGRVKFMFPNDFAIYLHDTPSKHLFKRDRRAYSHGCVRVQDPLRLAEALLAPQMDDPRGFIDRVLAAGKERYVNLAEHVPVHLVYRTAWVDAEGRAQFRSDVYGRDRDAARALRAAGVALPES